MIMPSASRCRQVQGVSADVGDAGMQSCQLRFCSFNTANIFTFATAGFSSSQWRRYVGLTHGFLKNVKRDLREIFFGTGHDRKL